ncbi:hypothetical protein QMN58_28490, partial [Escherichia coli]|nr:hypothetical protein [Escherichia coli]
MSVHCFREYVSHRLRRDPGSLQGLAASATRVAHRWRLATSPSLLELPMSTAYAYAATEANAPLVPFEIQRRE